MFTTLVQQHSAPRAITSLNPTAYVQIKAVYQGHINLLLRQIEHVHPKIVSRLRKSLTGYKGVLVDSRMLHTKRLGSAQSDAQHVAAITRGDGVTGTSLHPQRDTALSTKQLAFDRVTHTRGSRHTAE